jgi:hypothetical protein
MLEIYLINTDDSLVPLAAQALKNWRLNSDGDTLEIGLDDNTEPINIFDTTVYNGEDFYIELVKYKDFIPGITRRLVDYFFADKDEVQKQAIVNTIISSNPERWEDVFNQIIFSKEYLLNNQRTLNAEEIVFPLMKKINFRAKLDTFFYANMYIKLMKQAPMKYKLGKYAKVPVDSYSFVQYYRYIRERILQNDAIESYTDKTGGSYDGWLESFIGEDKFNLDLNEPLTSLKNYLNYLFNVILLRDIRDNEYTLFKDFMWDSTNSELRANYNLVDSSSDTRYTNRKYIAIIVLDYISRLEELYLLKEVQ